MTDFRMASPYVGKLRDTPQIWEHCLIFKHFLKVDIGRPALKFEKVILDTPHTGVLVRITHILGLAEFSCPQVSGN